MCDLGYEERGPRGGTGEPGGRPRARVAPRISHPSPRASQRGFTLVELLIALVMLGTLAGGLGLALSTGLEANERARRDGDAAQDVRVVMTALRADILQAAFTAGSDRSWFIGTDESDGERDTDSLRLITRSRRVPLRRFELLSSAWEAQTHDADWSAVTYWWTSVDDGDSTALYRREQTPPGSDPYEETNADTETGTNELLSEAVTALDLRFFDGEEWQTAWDTTTDTTLALPRVVEITLHLNGGDARIEGNTVTAAIPIRAALTATTEEEAASGGATP